MACTVFKQALVGVEGRKDEVDCGYLNFLSWPDTLACELYCITRVLYFASWGVINCLISCTKGYEV